MKTLDEVIKALELNTGARTQNCVKECPYSDDCSNPWECECYQRQDDALHYLKEYREKHDEILRMEEALGYCEMYENRPLTWEELKQMFHRPVWIETTAKKGWNIIVSIDSADMQVIHTAHRGPKLSGFSKADLGKTWQAYRKERNESDR